ncbi:MAG: putative metalloprotease CJM1_0395 family protein [Pseudomonadota bacterium]
MLVGSLATSTLFNGAAVSPTAGTGASGADARRAGNTTSPEFAVGASNNAAANPSEDTLNPTTESVNRASAERQSINGLTEQERQQVQELAARDREVRAHEQAHANVGGRFAGAPTYTFQRGPDGRQYAVGGEVAIDVSPVPGDPQATIEKARIVRRAALAPAEPSTQDRRVAAEATAIEQQARAELLAQENDTGDILATSSPFRGGFSQQDLASYRPISLRA